SYFNIYFNLRFERTLRRYSRPVNLARFDQLHWMTTEKPVWFVAEHLCEIPHIRLLTRAMEKDLTRLDSRSVRAEMTGHRKKARRSKSLSPRANSIGDRGSFQFQRRIRIADGCALKNVGLQKLQNTS